MLEPEAKEALAKTVRDLRARLLQDLRAQADGHYRLEVPLARAGLSEAARVERGRLEAWLEERVGSDRLPKESAAAARERHRTAAEKLAAATWLNRLVVVKLLEVQERVRPRVLTGGWSSVGYRDFRELAPELAQDDTEGFGTLLQLLFEELALDLPGLFGRVELVELFGPSPAMLRGLVEALDAPVLRSAWTDDTTLGWVYQYWNDPEREALDAKLNAGGKVEPHEIASKTQMFTERYMVEWLLHNSLGQLWLAMCKKHGWVAEVEKHGVLDRLEARRAEWRAKREAGEVALDALMPIDGGLEDRWKYWVRQPLPEDAVAAAPARLEDVRILDPACGSGHFLVIAFDLLHELYQEEARQRGERVDNRAIVERILEQNLHGIDLDPRAVQIAAAALMLKAWQVCPEARPRRLQLVASSLKLGALGADDPALVELRRGVREETGLPEALTDRIVAALAGADHLGSLLQVGKEVRGAIEEFVARRREEREKARQLSLFEAASVADDEDEEVDVEVLMEGLLRRLEVFLGEHTGSDDLGLRLHGEQLAAGMRFVRILQEESYDLVIGNPPYQGTSRLKHPEQLRQIYPRGRADLYAMFLERGLELVKPCGMSAMLTMRNWMFISQFREFRRHLLTAYDLRILGDLDRGAFEDVPDELVAVAMSIFRGAKCSSSSSNALQPTPLTDNTRDAGRTSRKRSALLAQVGQFTFNAPKISVIDGSPLIYWWQPEFLTSYAGSQKIGEVFEIRVGLRTSDNVRFLRHPSECPTTHWPTVFGNKQNDSQWVPYIKGAEGKSWLEPLEQCVNWGQSGLEMRVTLDHKYGHVPQSEEFYFFRGIAFSMIGNLFSARAHRFPSIIGDKGSSVFPDEVAPVLCALNTSHLKRMMLDLNPTVSFQVGDVARLPILVIAGASSIFESLEAAFTEHESHRETSVEFKEPGPSTWRYAQDWAQKAVDREEGAPLPPWEPEHDPEPAIDHLSYALGIALGRFGKNGEGILTEAPEESLPHGILFLNALNPEDDLTHPACDHLQQAWAEHGLKIDPKRDLKTWLRERHFQEDHRKRYEDRPIYLPISSENRTFVAWISIHRTDAKTLPALLTEHLRPALTTLEGELDDLRQAQNRSDTQTQTRTSRRHDALQTGRDELLRLITTVRQIAEQGPPPAHPDDPARETDAPFRLHLDDGVMISSAALWPLLEPQGWKKPRQWWSELSRAQGKTDYDWAHLARRYYPQRVAAKCAQDPSLAVAHGCFWQLHPAKAYEWELRLQDEIGPGFTLDEANAAELRQTFLDQHPGEAAALRKAEAKRRERKRKKQQRAEAEKRARHADAWHDDATDEETTDEETAEQDTDGGILPFDSEQTS